MDLVLLHPVTVISSSYRDSLPLYTKCDTEIFTFAQ